MGSPPPADKDYKATLLSFPFILPLCFYPFPPDGAPVQVSLLVLPFCPLFLLFLVINSSWLLMFLQLQRDGCVSYATHTLLSVTCPAAAEASYQTGVIEQQRSYFEMH